MTIGQFLKTLGRTAALGLSAVSIAQESLVTNVTSFEIPFDVEAPAGQAPEGFAVLFGSQDGGATWEKLQTVPAAQQQSFRFSAPRDGSYGFAVRMMDAQGNLQSSVNGSTPELEVIVDTSAPEIRVEAYEVSAGQVIVSWQCVDPRLDLQSLTIEYTDGQDSRWKQLRTTAAETGQATLNVPPGSVVSVRGSITDSAGNRAEGSAQLVLNAARNSMPPAGPAIPGSGQRAVSGTALGPSPFSAPPSIPVQGTDAASWGSGTSVTSASTTTGSPSAFSSPVPQEPSGEFDAQSSGFYSGDPGKVMSAGSEGIQLVNTSAFDIAYELEDVGPSGVGAVELFVTEDGGQQWFRYGTDADLRSPFQVDVQGEGTFGFAVRVRNGLGFADTPPQPGEPPTIIVSVDQSPPVIDFPQPTLAAEGNGVVVLNWRINEVNAAASPVRLEYAGTAAGPWTPLMDWQTDPGSYQWAVRPGTPSAVYFRVLARDAAGNIAFAQTPQPVLIDLKRPVARGLRVQPASATTQTIPR